MRISHFKSLFMLYTFLKNFVIMMQWLEKCVSKIFWKMTEKKKECLPFQSNWSQIFQHQSTFLHLSFYFFSTLSLSISISLSPSFSQSLSLSLPSFLSIYINLSLAQYIRFLYFFLLLSHSPFSFQSSHRVFNEKYYGHGW